MTRRILITGASVAGYTAARWLGRAGFDVTVVERAPAFRDGDGAKEVVSSLHDTPSPSVSPTVPVKRLSPVLALGVVGVVLGASALVGRRNAPDPSHPGIRRWYRRLDKPGFTPPDAAFGAVWTVLETGLAVGGYRLLRSPPGGARNAAVGLWLLNTAMVGGWTQLFFRDKRLGASAAASGAMVATGGRLCRRRREGGPACGRHGGAVRRMARLRDDPRRTDMARQSG